MEFFMYSTVISAENQDPYLDTFYSTSNSISSFSQPSIWLIITKCQAILGLELHQWAEYGLLLGHADNKK